METKVATPGRVPMWICFPGELAASDSLLESQTQPQQGKCPLFHEGSVHTVFIVSEASQHNNHGKREPNTSVIPLKVSPSSNKTSLMHTGEKLPDKQG